MNPAPVVTPAKLPPALSGQPYSATLTITEGTAPFNFTAALEDAGTVTGLTVTTNQSAGTVTVSGTPQGVSAVGLGVTGTDASGATIAAGYTIDVVKLDTKAGPGTTYGSGNSLSDSVTIDEGQLPGDPSGAHIGFPKGTVTFTLADPDGNVVETDNEILAATGALPSYVVATSQTYVPILAGTYTWEVAMNETGGTISVPGGTEPVAAVSSISGVAFSGPLASPTITVNGTGFGSSPPSPSYPANLCGGTGSLYGNALFFEDTTASWTAGQGASSATGNCIGLTVTSWSSTQIVLGFGSSYGTNGWVLTPGDHYTLVALGSQGTGTITSPTTTAVSSSQNPSATGKAVTYTATVSGSDDGGTVSFSHGGAAISGCQGVALNSSGQAACTTTPSVGGAHQIVATYSGDTGFAGSTSSAFTQTVATVIVSSAAAPPLVSASPFSVVFSGPVQGVSTANFTVNEVGYSTGIAASVACANASSAPVSCVTGPVTSATLTPTKPLIAGEYYFVLANQAAGGIVAAADGTAVPASETYTRAQTQFNAFQYPTIYKWATVKDASALGGSYVEETYPGATASFTAKGTSVGIVTWDAPDGGTATVTVTNGTHPVTQSIDTYAASAGDQTTTISGLSVTGTHTITVSVNGAGDPESSGSWVRIDGTIVGGVTQPTPKLTFLWPNYPGDYSYTGSEGASVSLTFRGTGVVWTALTGPNDGKAKVVIDGSMVATEDLHAASYGSTTYTFANLSQDGFHTITITALGTQYKHSSGDIVTNEGFTVQ